MGDSPLQAQMIFVVGARRSGTNWLQRILGAHPDVFAMPSETYLFSRGIGPLAQLFQHALPGSPTPGRTFMPRDAFIQAVRQFTDRAFVESIGETGHGATYLVERTPWHVYDLELIASVYPDAPILHIIRDGRDVARSLVSKNWGPDKIEAAAAEWRSSVEAGRAAGASLPSYSEVFYERLLADPEAEIRSLYGGLGLETTPEVIDTVLAEARSAFNVDAGSPTIRSEKWRTALTRADLRAFDRVAGPLLEELGYAREAPPSGGVREALVRAAVRAGEEARRTTRPRQAIRGVLDHALLRHAAAVREGNTWIVQRLEDDLARGREAVLEELLRPDARVLIVDAGEVWRGRGREGLKRLRKALRTHYEQDMAPLTGDVHPGAEGTTLVGTYRLGDGSVWARTLILGHAGKRLRRLALYRHELASRNHTHSLAAVGSAAPPQVSE